MFPFTIELDFKRGILQPCNNIIQRHLSDMRGMYLDEAATEEAIEENARWAAQQPQA